MHENGPPKAGFTQETGIPEEEMDMPGQWTSNWQESYDYLASKGMPCMMEGSLGGGAYFDAHTLGDGVNIELIDFNTKGHDWFARLVD